MDADKSLARTGRKQANVSVSPSAPCLAGKKKLDDSSRLDVVLIARPRHASELVSFLVGLRTYQHPGNTTTC